MWRFSPRLIRSSRWTSTFARPESSTTRALPSLSVLLSSHKSHHQQDESHKLLVSFLGMAMASCGIILGWNTRQPCLEEAADDDTTTKILNWSGTHSVLVPNDSYWEPESIAEVEAIVQKCHAQGRSVRPVGSALSPNGLAFEAQGMMSMAHLDSVVKVDTVNRTVTAQAGARVSQVIEALRPHNLTLPNLASIAEQQMGGFVQVGAHGTGKAIAPVDHYVTKLKIVTPSQGMIELTSQDEDDELFHLTKVGLGCLGIVVEVTMQCIPAHDLVEHTFVLTRQQAREQRDELLEKHKHMRYMWIPFEDAVVVVTNDPEETLPQSVPRQTSAPLSTKQLFQPLTDLLLTLSQEYADNSTTTTTTYTKETIEGMGFGELRDALLAFDPLNVDHVKRVNKAEAEFWRNSEGYQTKPSDQLLQFDCGGQQWVWEVCFPTGSQERNNGNDMDFMEELLAGIERDNIPAPAPIEQRWSASSSSYMSPAYSRDPQGLHSWVGIIHYLPSDEEWQRRAITESFTGKYCDLMRKIGQQYSATSHWAKLEIPKSIFQVADLRLFMQSRFPVALFNETRARMDPKSILSNRTVDMAFGKPGHRQ
ncbi:galactono-1,4-lactone dehydrogenase 2, mitochondrial [Seminavis robusta]|uniref:Galactono-1,4-lactone dehydrogenase 2, mitochondrial n=1 Tax=Seminavis robusta TaxID=568900 RepID=A0A9N8DKY4_9STRA|nr:galactono-1,4-lactone dehydrogenase 2, mitochondrial [Seminavis robusta]|eukprot:Sro199_g084400.1 galactono-1,4-lactone dehydrogenase 2, mitochondrial (592) ;mRNA; r:53766-55624